jgi:hypothetical protein
MVNSEPKMNNADSVNYRPRHGQNPTTNRTVHEAIPNMRTIRFLREVQPETTPFIEEVH